MEKVNELNDVRKLATIARIEEIKPIEGADNIEHARIRGWWVVTRKNEFKVGDLCVYCEVDAIMPDGLNVVDADRWKNLNKQMSKVDTDEERAVLRTQMAEITKLNTCPEFEFLRGVKFHIKTRRILSEISQGICFPISIIGKYIIRDADGTPWAIEYDQVKPNIKFEEGADVTEALGVTQYIAPDPAVMGGDAAGLLTNLGILCSDEERVENLSMKYDELRQFTYYKTEKCEGTSFCAYIKDGKFGVCGRTIDFKVPEEDLGYDEMNVYWKVAKKFDMETKMRSLIFGNLSDKNFSPMKNFALQGELIGEGIQKNIYKLKGQKVMFYNAFLIDEQEYVQYDIFLAAIKSLGLETVPILDQYYRLPENAIDLLKEADVTYSVLNPQQLIEGFVYIASERMTPLTKLTRSSFGRCSFKAKSRTYDLNKNK